MHREEMTQENGWLQYVGRVTKAYPTGWSTGKEFQRGCDVHVGPTSQTDVSHGGVECLGSNARGLTSRNMCFGEERGCGTADISPE